MEENGQKPTGQAEKRPEDQKPAEKGSDGGKGKPEKITVPLEAGLKAEIVGGSRMPE